MPQIIIDSREPTDKIMDILVNQISSYALYPNFKIEALEYGDYYLENNNKTCLIERKNYNDYLQSIDEHLKKRLLKMKQEVDFAVLLLEGQPPQVDHHVYYRNGGMLCQSIKFNVYNNFMFSRGIDGIIIIPTTNLKHTMLSILSIYYYLGNIDKRSAPKAKNSEELIALFPGIGPKKARKVLKQYNNSVEMALDNWREWIDIKKLNKLEE